MTDSLKAAQDKVWEDQQEPAFTAEIRYMRIAPVNGRRVAYAQLYDSNGVKVYPDRVPDAPLSAILGFADDEEYEITNTDKILYDLVRVHGFSA